MRENVVDEMRQMQPDDESRKKMLEILKRFHSEEETDSVDEDGTFLLLFLLLQDHHLFHNLFDKLVLASVLSFFWKGEVWFSHSFCSS